ncbi:unnamed protein product, partial [Brassica oleracea]
GADPKISPEKKNVTKLITNRQIEAVSESPAKTKPEHRRICFGAFTHRQAIRALASCCRSGNQAPGVAEKTGSPSTRRLH